MSTAPTARESTSARGLVWVASVALCGLLPAIVIVTVFAAAIWDGPIAMDFGQFYRGARAILEGQSPYLGGAEPWGGPYPYPPLPALTAIPLTGLPLDVAGVVVMASLVGAVLATLHVLGVRDWRCYGVALLWPPVISAIQTGNVTLWFALALAVVWRCRDRPVPAAGALGLTLAVKFFLWPVAVWLAATRRYATAALSGVVGVQLFLLSWAPLGFSGLVEYPDLVRRLERTVGEDSYTLYISALDLGLSSTAARGVWLAAGVLLLSLVVVIGRWGDQRTAFVLSVGACLTVTPIVWLHYFALLLVVVALARPRLGALWFVPLLMVLTPGSGHPSPFETSWTLAVAALVIGWAVKDSRAVARAGSLATASEGHVRPA
jgi:hypothetical protein